MIDLHTWPTPNGHKVHIMLEEIGLEYRVIPVDINQGAQFEPDFLAISPNNKMPAMIDHDGPNGESYPLFESGAILMYLAEKTGMFLPRDTAEHYTVLQWLFFQVGNVGPLFGQCGHFQGYAPEKIPYAIDRYYNETLRLYRVLDTVLGERDYLAGDYSIADIATYPWVMPDVRELHKLDIDQFPNVRRWHDTIAARPAVERGSALLADDLKYGDPTDEAFDNLFGRRQTEVG